MRGFMTRKKGIRMLFRLKWRDKKGPREISNFTRTNKAIIYKQCCVQIKHEM